MKKIASLARRSFRIRHGLLLVEGPQAVEAVLVACPQQVTDVYFQVSQAEASTAHRSIPAVFSPLPALIGLAELALSVLPWVHPVTASVAKTIAPSAQGVFATVKLGAIPAAFPANISETTDFSATIDDNGTTVLDGLADSAPDFVLPRGFSVLLPETKDPGNLGTIIRLADACGVNQVLVCKGSADPTSPKVIRSSAGSVFHLPVYYPLDFKQVSSLAATQGAALLAADLRRSVLLSEVLSSPLVRGDLIWAFGNEAHGFSTEQLAGVTQTVSLPMWGKAESLNVASAAAIILHATASQRFLSS